MQAMFGSKVSYIFTLKFRLYLSACFRSAEEINNPDLYMAGNLRRVLELIFIIIEDDSTLQ